MAIIKESEELKKYLSSVEGDYQVASLQSFINDAEQNIVVSWIGVGIFNAAVAAYDAGGAEGVMSVLIDHLQKAVTHLAFMLAADSGSFRISDSGFFVSYDQTNKPVSDKKMSMFYKGRRESGYQALEQTVGFLEVNINDAAFAAYKASDEHEQHCAYFINSSVEFTRYFKKVNNSAYLFNQLTDALDRAERKYVKPVLGNAFFASLKSKILSKTLSPNEKTLIRYIARALANFTVAMGLPGLQVEIDGQQIVVSSSPAYGNSENVENKAAATPQQISLLVSQALSAGEMELLELEDYLLENAASFEAYIVPEASEDFNINDPSDPTFFV